ncbi:unnamed protein product [Sphenostylis stenocarpa]|uniref:Uncharacterized protein n=1 Tax=Sphenostylis stenocarpa TaxID=92480 RepID=A0AA86VKM8_9FABA|nr:unnamed protein product [Sphenostylis stenocarpa]
MNRSHGLYMQRSQAVHAVVTGCTANFTCSQLIELEPKPVVTGLILSSIVGSSPAAINFGVTLSHQQLAWYLVGGTPQCVCDHSDLRLYLKGHRQVRRQLLLQRVSFISSPTGMVHMLFSMVAT